MERRWIWATWGDTPPVIVIKFGFFSDILINIHQLLVRKERLAHYRLILRLRYL
jgi:hypothetical protein